MLPLELLRVRTRKGFVTPLYAEINEANLALAKELLELFNRYTGKRKGDLQNQVSTYEDSGFDHRFVRGLAAILQRRCTFQIQAAVNPLVVRRLIFEAASHREVVCNIEDRNAVMKNVAQQLNASTQELERSFYADLEDEQVLEQFTPVSAPELLKLYNFALTQTLLFRSTFIEIKLSSHWKEVLREVKFKGLMYSAETRNKEVCITIDGPLSIFKLTQRYGTNMAKLLPQITQANEWEINGDIIRAGQLGKRIFRLKLKSRNIGDKIKPFNLQVEDKTTAFDSLVEESFFKSFQAIRSGWRIRREPEAIVVGKHVFIPDFSFEKGNKTIYLEIAGFWTQKYLETKIRKLRKLPDIDIIIAADQKLACEKLKQVKGEILFYKRKVPIKAVLKILKKHEETLLNNEIAQLNLANLHLEGDIIELSDIAKKYRISKEALKKKLQGVEIIGYSLIGDLFVSDNKLQDLDSRLSTSSNLTLSQGINLLETEGVKNPYDVLSTLGYTIKWSGLDLENSIIFKNKSNIKELVDK